jgi:hypothetical protein
LRLQSDVGADLLCLKCGKNKKSRNLKLRKIIQYLYGVLAGTTKNVPKMWQNLNQETSNQDNTVVENC